MNAVPPLVCRPAIGIMLDQLTALADALTMQFCCTYARSTRSVYFHEMATCRRHESKWRPRDLVGSNDVFFGTLQQQQVSMVLALTAQLISQCQSLLNKLKAAPVPIFLMQQPVTARHLAYKGAQGSLQEVGLWVVEFYG